MWNMNKVIEINYQQGYIFNVVFDDGTCGNVDFSTRNLVGTVKIMTMRRFDARDSESRSITDDIPFQGCHPYIHGN
jgi:hypothetical protein